MTTPNANTSHTIKVNPDHIQGHIRSLSQSDNNALFVPERADPPHLPHDQSMAIETEHRELHVSTSPHPVDKDMDGRRQAYVKPGTIRLVHSSTRAKEHQQDDNAGSFDFNSFEKAVKCRGFEVADSEISLFKQQFIESLPLKAGGINFIRSPKGSGKTEFSIQSIPEDASVLLIGHRRALMRNLAIRLGLECYLDIKAKAAPNRFAICLDSISSYIFTRPYDYIIFDESEQVLSHIAGKTMKEKRYKCIEILQDNMRNDDTTIVCLDADLSWLSYTMVKRWAGRAIEKPSTIFFNDSVIERGSIAIFEKKRHITDDILASVENGSKIYIASNNKSYLNKLYSLIIQKDNSARALIITSDTNKRKDSPPGEFMRSPVLEAQKYDVILASPAVGTGVDISFPDKMEYFDVLYGVFESGVNTHFECDQQLARVRHPGDVRIFIASGRRQSETSRSAVEDDMSRSDLFDSSRFQDERSRQQVEMQSGLLELAILVEMNRRASLNDLRENFLDYKRKDGWTISHVSSDQGVNGEGRSLPTD